MNIVINSEKVLHFIIFFEKKTINFNYENEFI